MVGIACKALAQFRVLCCYTYRAGIHMTLTHHNATFYYQCSSSYPPFFSTQQCSNSNIAPGFHLSVCLYSYTAAQFVANQGLMRFCQPQFPGQACMFNGAYW